MWSPSTDHGRGCRHGLGASPFIVLAVALTLTTFVPPQSYPLPGIPEAGRFAVQATPGTWINVTTASLQRPPLDYWASMALDATDGEIVLFGGCTSSACPTSPQTWTFSRGAWTNVTDLGPQPPARSYAAMTYDSADGYVVMFGGVGTSSVFGDTWTFSGRHWTNLTASVGRAVPPRWGESLAYDPVDRGVVLFGGNSPTGAILNDTWLYSRGTWRNITPAASPPARYEASMAWDAVDSNLVLLDGCGVAACPLNDTWVYANGTWTGLPPSAGVLPPARDLSSMTYDGIRGVVRLFGGIASGVSLGDTWEYSGGRWAVLSPPTVPRPREGSAALESTETWLPNGTSVVWPFEVLWGGDFVPCPGCALRGLEDTWVFEVPPQTSVVPGSSSTVAGQTAAFRASVIGGAPPYSFTWNFGDGSAGSGSNVTHVYAAGGRYDMRLTVTDDAGATAAAGIVLDVISPPPSPFLIPGAIAVFVTVGALAGVVFLRRRNG